MFFLRVQWRVRAVLVVLLRWRRCRAWLLSGWCLRALLLSCGAAPAAARFVFFVGARGAWWSRCVFVFLARAAGLPVRVLGCRAAFFFLVRAAGGRCACLFVALRFFSWCAPRACGARAWLLRCVFFLGACRGRAVRVLGCCAAFFFLVRAGGVRCACLVVALRFLLRVLRAGGARALRLRCVFFLLVRVAGGVCVLLR